MVGGGGLSRDVFVGGAGACAEEDEDEAVNQDSSCHKCEDPEIVQPETIRLVFSVDPALSYVSLESPNLQVEYIPRR